MNQQSKAASPRKGYKNDLQTAVLPSLLSYIYLLGNLFYSLNMKKLPFLIFWDIHPVDVSQGLKDLHPPLE